MRLFAASQFPAVMELPSRVDSGHLMTKIPCSQAVSIRGTINKGHELTAVSISESLSDGLAVSDTEQFEPDAEWNSFVKGLVSGDQIAYNEFWDKYGNRLSAVARNNFPRGLNRRLAPEDIVQSTCRSFFHRVTTGRLELSDSEALWRLLCAITLNKTRMKHRFHLAQRRAANREQSAEVESPDGSTFRDEVVDKEQMPDEALMFAEQLEGIMELLDDTERRILQLKLEDHTNDEIAELVERSERTVRRVLKRLQEKLEATLPEGTITSDASE